MCVVLVVVLAELVVELVVELGLFLSWSGLPVQRGEFAEEVGCGVHCLDINLTVRAPRTRTPRSTHTLYPGPDPRERSVLATCPLSALTPVCTCRGKLFGDLPKS